MNKSNKQRENRQGKGKGNKYGCRIPLAQKSHKNIKVKIIKHMERTCQGKKREEKVQIK